MRADFEILGGSLLNKLLKEQELEVNPWFDERQARRGRELFEYVEGRYEAMLRRCPLYQRLRRDGRVERGATSKFLTLIKSRDELGRTLKFREMRGIDEPTLALHCNFAYLRWGTLKKFLALALLPEKSHRNEAIRRGILTADFASKLQRNLFLGKPDAPGDRRAQLDAGSSRRSSYSDFGWSNGCSEAGSSSEPGSDTSGSIILSQGSGTRQVALPMEDYLPKSKGSVAPRGVEIRAYDAEMITMEGANFGKLMVNSNCISFRSEERKESKKYRYGSSPLIQIVRDVNKKWKLEDVTEVVLKRYNLIRQAVEVYFRNSKSVFFSLYGKGYVKDFVRQLETIAGKNKSLRIEVVMNPEQYFERKRFREAWTAGETSNFAYLMLLNKYGGRSFNDLNQYPIFPWVLSNYTEDRMDLDDPRNYRELNWPIGAITPAKREQVRSKYTMLVTEQEPHPYQIGTHCLPGRTMLGYVFRVEPFSSILIQFENGRDSPSRMLHVLSRAWMGGITDPNDNKELVPEFFYLPELFSNHNNYSYGVKPPDEDILQFVDNPFVKVRVDQVLLPKWAKNKHHFVKMNALALENRQASRQLDQWIDLVFGESQQSEERCNVYKHLCDEEYVSRNVESLTESNMQEIQYFGSNPIQLFEAKHPAKNQRAIDVRTQYGVFRNLLGRGDTDCVFALMRIKAFGRDEAVACIKAYGQRVYAITNTLKMHRTKEEYVNALHERPVRFEAKELKLCPCKRVFINKSMTFIGDPARVFDFIEKGSIAVTCRHYDNTCRLIATDSGRLLAQISFHSVSRTHITRSPSLTQSARRAIKRAYLRPLPTACSRAGTRGECWTTWELRSGFPATSSPPS